MRDFVPFSTATFALRANDFNGKSVHETHDHSLSMRSAGLDQDMEYGIWDTGLLKAVWA